MFLVFKARLNLFFSQLIQKQTSYGHQPNNTCLILGALAITVAIVLSLCLFFDPRWHTNDDVAMSMIAHGYGLVAIGSPNLVFSNVFWGYLVRSIPEMNGVLGYSIATLGVIVVVGTVVIYSLFRISEGYLVSLLVLALIIVRPVLFPQFTINAGLLMVGAIACWHLFALQNNWRPLLIGCLLAFFSFLVRWEEFFLVFFVALPLLPWRTLLLRWSSRILFLALIFAIAISAIINHHTYQSSEWKTFNELRPAVSPFVDFGVGEYLKQRPDILERHGYSINDVNLLGNWFFVDSKIANPNALHAMVAELGTLPVKTEALANGWAGLKSLKHRALIPLILAAIMLALLHPNWRVAASWALFITAIFVLGVIGRPGVIRVIFPLVSLLTIAPFLVIKVTVWRQRLGVSVLLLACLINTSLVFSESKSIQISADTARIALTEFPNEPIIVWGAALPFESIYPVLGASTDAMHYQLYSLASFTLAPFSVSFTESQAGHGMIERLLSEKGVSIVGVDLQFKYLDIYCKEHLHGHLKELFAKQYGTILLSQRRCELNVYLTESN